MDIVERLDRYKGTAFIMDDINDAKREIERLRQVCRDAYEVWAGSEGIPEPKYASEAYLLSLLEQMRDEVKKGL